MDGNRKETADMAAAVHKMFKYDYSQSDVARRFGVSRQTAHRWHILWKENGEDGLQNIGRRGCSAKSDNTRWVVFEHALEYSSKEFGYTDGKWTLQRMVSVFENLFGIKYSTKHMSRILEKKGWRYDRELKRWIKKICTR